MRAHCEIYEKGAGNAAVTWQSYDARGERSSGAANGRAHKSG
jgi:hypothetical protein